MSLPGNRERANFTSRMHAGRWTCSWGPEWTGSVQPSRAGGWRLAVLQSGFAPQQRLFSCSHLRHRKPEPRVFRSYFIQYCVKANFRSLQLAGRRAGE